MHYHLYATKQRWSRFCEVRLTIHLARDEQRLKLRDQWSLAEERADGALVLGRGVRGRKRLSCGCKRCFILVLLLT